MSDDYLRGTVLTAGTASAQATVALDGSSVALRCWTGEAPVSVGDRVILIRLGKELYVVSSRETTAPLATFRSYNNSSSSVAAGANAPMTTILEDNLSGWSATNNNYTIMQAGLYMINGALKQGTSNLAALNVYINVNGANRVRAGAGSSAAYSGGAVNYTDRFTVGQTVSIVNQGAITLYNDNPAFGCYLNITQLR